MHGKLVMTIVIPGTLGAAVDFKTTIPSPCTIQQLSMVQSNSGDARIKIGTSSDDDAYLAFTDAGQSGTPVVLDALSDWIGYVRPDLSKDDVFAFYVEHDGEGCSAADDLTLIITFTEG